MNIIEHSLQAYYNPIYNGFHALHSVNKNIATIGSCSKFYNDAYTCILRYEVHIKVLNDWMLIDKQNLLNYNFVCIDENINNVRVRETINDNDDMYRYYWVDNVEIIKRYMIR
jgi:hypothetical protein